MVQFPAACGARPGAVSPTARSIGKVVPSLPPSGTPAAPLWATLGHPQISWFAGFQFFAPLPHRLRCQFRWSVSVRQKNRKGIDLNGVLQKAMCYIGFQVRDRFGPVRWNSTRGENCYEIFTFGGIILTVTCSSQVGEPNTGRYRIANY